ncbi:integrase [Syntrophotalea acetylenivorans]|uniref:Integrase n=1 Tax=Syntrophotalea acetylenivorans TaxID=1842532 RepID=A0A1L3GR65_9BACT|nr:site-specific integrase [Syntrophotalea acetylenivorans]APG28439.1 integrase [Syntrophotalea acetylenivorans]
MASIIERTLASGEKRYQVIIRRKGYPTETASFPRKTDAKRWAKTIEAAMIENRHFKTAQSRKHTLEELIDRYTEEVLPTKGRHGKAQQTQLMWWKTELGPYLLCDLTAAMITTCRDKLQAEVTYRKRKRSPSTVNRYLAALSHAFSIAIKEWEWISDNPVAKIRKPKEPQGRIRFLDKQEIQRLLNACHCQPNRFLYTAVALALSTGMRQGEILNLRWKDIDFNRKQLVLHKTKNKERRTVPLASMTQQVLRELAAESHPEHGLVFAEEKADRPANFRKSWEKALREADIRDFRFHDLRHTAASHMAMNKATVSEIAAVLGHKTFQMVKRYAHLSEAHTRSVVESMNERMFETEEEEDEPESVATCGEVLWRSAA